MNIIEEQHLSGEHNAEFTSNMQAPSSGPSAKKVYSKTTLVIIHPQHHKTPKLPVTSPVKCTSQQGEIGSRQAGKRKHSTFKKKKSSSPHNDPRTSAWGMVVVSYIEMF